ncbi:hypothetical protein, partial [Lactiplantibacillus fabifermentans]
KKARTVVMEETLPYLEQQHCIFHGVALIASIDPQALTPELRQMRDNMIKAMDLNALMINRGLK